MNKVYIFLYTYISLIIFLCRNIKNAVIPIMNCILVHCINCSIYNFGYTFSMIQFYVCKHMYSHIWLQIYLSKKKEKGKGRRKGKKDERKKHAKMDYLWVVRSQAIILSSQFPIYLNILLICWLKKCIIMGFLANCPRL